MVTSVMSERCYIIYGKSTDVKPMERIGNGSVFHEIDTSKTYLFDEEHKEWHQVSNCAQKLIDIW